MPQSTGNSTNNDNPMVNPTRKTDAGGAKKSSAIDWDVIFDHPETGLVPLIYKARSAKALQQYSKVIGDALFNRQGDEERRRAFSTVVNDILEHTAKGGHSNAVAFSTAKTKICQVLHSVKEDRQNRARQVNTTNVKKIKRTRDLDIVEDIPVPSADAKPGDETWKLNIATKPTQATQTAKTNTTQDAAPPAESRQDDTPPDGTPDDDTPEQEETLFGGYKEGTPEAFFIYAMGQAIDERLAVLRGQSIDTRHFADGIPYVLSAEFASRFNEFLCEQVLPQLVFGCYVMINRMAVRQKEEWGEFLKKALLDRADRVILWERWQIAWLDCTTQRDLPPKPDFNVPKVKKGLFAFLAKLAEDDHYDDEDDGELTEEEWREAVRIANIENAKAKDNWQNLCEPGHDYIAPVDADNRVLMEIFGHDPEIYIENIARLQKIVKLESGRARQFESYQCGDNLDLPLLSVCYRYPKVMLQGDVPVLSTFVASFDDNWKDATLPLTTRYLSDKMKRVYTEDEPY